MIKVIKAIKIVAYMLVLIGALNWGLVGIFGFNLVAFLFGDMTRTARVIYALVGISAITLPMLAYICYDEAEGQDKCI